jgi:hypothetical protein
MPMALTGVKGATHTIMYDGDHFEQYDENLNTAQWVCACVCVNSPLLLLSLTLSSITLTLSLSHTHTRAHTHAHAHTCFLV